MLTQNPCVHLYLSTLFSTIVIYFSISYTYDKSWYLFCLFICKLSIFRMFKCYTRTTWVLSHRFYHTDTPNMKLVNKETGGICVCLFYNQIYLWWIRTIVFIKTFSNLVVLMVSDKMSWLWAFYVYHTLYFLNYSRLN